jgi:hypothetical protein
VRGIRWSNPIVFVIGAMIVCVVLAFLLSYLKVAVGGIAQAAGFSVAIWLIVWAGAIRDR